MYIHVSHMRSGCVGMRDVFMMLMASRIQTDGRQAFYIMYYTRILRLRHIRIHKFICIYKNIVVVGGIFCCYCEVRATAACLRSTKYAIIAMYTYSL